QFTPTCSDFPSIRHAVPPPKASGSANVGIADASWHAQCNYVSPPSRRGAVNHDRESAQIKPPTFQAARMAPKLVVVVGDSRLHGQHHRLRPAVHDARLHRPVAPRLSWHGFLNIEPNTYIAIIATASRTAITVPIASCLSHLKWRHFQNRAHRLNHLDLIDKASRGPWGSLQALFMLGKANMVISMLAITTILSLAIGPSVQQVLEIHTREAIDSSRIPELAYATNYTSKVLYMTQNDSATLEGVEPMSRLQFASNMIRGITKNGTVLSSLCIGGSCRWPEYTTLGMCCASSLTSEGPIQDSAIWKVNCTYNIPEDTYGILVLTPDDWTTRRYLPWSTEPLRRRDLDDRDDSVYWVAPSTNAKMVLDPQSRDYVMDTIAFFLKEILNSLTSDSSS
ncbi:hypothetical protein BN1708_011768, partial [Verticillium longisporum]